AKLRDASFLEHGHQFRRWTRQKDDMISSGANPESRSRSVLVFENVRSGEDERLTRVVLRHFNAACLESFLDRFQARIVEHELTLKDTRHDFLGDIVFCGSEPADRDDDGCAFETSAQSLIQIVFVVAHNRLHHDGYTDFIELPGEVHRIRVYEIRHQQFGADCDDFGGQHGGQGRGLPVMPSGTENSDPDSATIRLSSKSKARPTRLIPATIGSGPESLLLNRRMPRRPR